MPEHPIPTQKEITAAALFRTGCETCVAAIMRSFRILRSVSAIDLYPAVAIDPDDFDQPLSLALPRTTRKLGRVKAVNLESFELNWAAICKNFEAAVFRAEENLVGDRRPARHWRKLLPRPGPRKYAGA